MKCALQISEPGFRPVVKTYVRETDVLIHFSHRREAHSRAQGEKGGDAEDGDGPATLIGTSEHPFWSLTRNHWVNMGEPEVGERLRLDNGSAIVTGVKEKVLAAPVKVNNFQVADHHTCFASPAKGDPFVWVHNANYSLPNGKTYEGKSLHEIADEIRSAGHKIAASRRTIAVGLDQQGQLWVASSNTLDKGMKAAAARLGVRQVPSLKGLHAEESLIRQVSDLMFVGTSKRLPCGPGEHNCQSLLDSLKIALTNPR